jgi:hypothetical protein
MASEEVIWGEWVLRLDDNVVEILHRSGHGFRYHVNHVAVEGKLNRDGLRLRVGIDVNGTIVEGTTLEVPTQYQAQVEALFAEARKRRAAAGGPPVA